MRVRLPGSIRLRITAVATLGVALVLCFMAIVILSVQRGQLFENLDNSLEQRADSVAGSLASGNVGALAVSDDGDRFVQLATTSGEIVIASANVVDLEPIVDPARTGEFVTVSGFALEDDAFRVLITELDDDRVLYVAENIDDVNDAIRNLRLALGTAVPAVVVVLALLTWWLVGRTLEPVARIRSEVTEIRVGALDRRVQPPATDDEIADLVETMNEMLDRVEDATTRQQAFVADASHELRTPLARMRTELEVDIGQVGEPGVLAASMLEEVIGLQALVDDLLHLAQADAGAEGTRKIPLDLDDIVLREARVLRETSPHTVDISGVSAAHLDGDPGQLLRVVRNLTDNAMRHAASRIELRLFERAGVLRFEISDDGDGSPAGDLDAMFDRFTRLDPSRTVDTGGTGLGLAIVRDVVTRHGGRVWAEACEPSGLRFVVELPSTPH